MTDLLKNGFLGTPASIMLDVVVCSLVLVVPTLLFSIYLVKRRRKYDVHKHVQLTLGLVLLLVVILFEVDMRLQGGFWAMASQSPYYNTAFMVYLLYVHLFFAVSTVIMWSITYYITLKRFPSPPRPTAFSPTHRVLAWISVVDMGATVVTGLMVYYFGFWVTTR